VARTPTAHDPGPDLHTANVDDRPTGPDQGPDAPLPPTRRGPGLGPALVVGAIAVGLILVFGVLSVVSTGHTTTSPSVSTRPVAVAGSSLKAVPAVTGLGPIEQADTPPANILDSLTLPVGSTPVPHGHSVSNTNQYDGQMAFTASSTEATLVAFYRSELDRHGWKIVGVAPATGIPEGVEVLSEQAGSDGWYWEVGAVVSPTRFTGPAGVHQSTRFQLRLFEVPDAS
jgi:hypothetical protein